MTIRNQLSYGAALICFAAAADAGAAAAASTPAAKAKTVADDMDSRRIFDNVDAAIPYLTMCAETFTDFADIPLASVGIDSEGNFDPEIYTEQMAVMISTLSKVKKGGQPGGVKAIIVTPIPKVSALLETDAGRAFVDKIMAKELNHVAVRALRDAEDISTVTDQMPSTLDAYIASGRGDGGGIMETFNELFKQMNTTLSQNIAVWAKARLTKGELKKALESKGYAEEYYPALENRGEGKDSLFVVALGLGLKAATAKGLDPTIFQRWLDTRATKAFNAGDQDDADDFDVDSLSESLLASADTTDAATAQDEAPATTEATTTEDAPAT